MRKFLLRLLLPRDHMIIPMELIEEAPEYTVGFIHLTSRCQHDILTEGTD